MKLELEGRPAIPDAQAGDVHDAVSALGLPGHSFLILTRTPTSYVQVAMQAAEQFVIEYRDGDPGGLRSAREDFSRNEVAQLFESYLAGGEAWRAGMEWRPVEGFGRPRDAWDTVSNVFAVASIAVFFGFACSIEATGRHRTSRPDPMEAFAIAVLVFLPSALIDMRRFKRMGGKEKMRTMAALFFAVIAVLYWIDRWR
jgi:hypothetical protein